MSSRVDSKSPVVDSDLVEGRCFLVAKERVRDPEEVPAPVVQSDVIDSPIDGLEDQTWITPRLPEVHTQRIILRPTAK